MLDTIVGIAVLTVLAACLIRSAANFHFGLHETPEEMESRFGKLWPDAFEACKAEASKHCVDGTDASLQEGKQSASPLANGDGVRKEN